MPIDADAYMAGCIPALSRGGSWQPAHRSATSQGLPSSPASMSPRPHMASPPYAGSGGASPDGHPSAACMHFGAAAGSIAGPLAYTQRGSAAHNGWARASVPPSLAGDRRAVASQPAGSPTLAPTIIGTDLGHVPRSSHYSVVAVQPSILDSRHLPGRSWEHQAGAPKPLAPEPDYRQSRRASHSYIKSSSPGTAVAPSPRRPRADTLPPVPTETTTPPRTRHKSASHTSSSGHTRMPPLSSSSRQYLPTRPSIPRRHTHAHQPSPLSRKPSDRTRLVSDPAKGDRPMRAVSSGSLDFAALRSALPPVPDGYISPLSEEAAYDRYAAHPAAPTPPRADGVDSPNRPGTPLRTATTALLTTTTTKTHGGALPGDYQPVGYPQRTRTDMLPTNREGPAMRTYGVPWMSDVPPLSSTPDGPRWTVARPPRAEIVQGGGWWQAGGHGE